MKKQAFGNRLSRGKGLFDLDDGPPRNGVLVCSVGGGVDSSAMLVGFHNRGIRPHLIMFADTKAEKPPTYRYLKVLDEWCRAVGFPPITVVSMKPVDGKYGRYESLTDDCLLKGMLPSLAYGRHSCSTKYKVAPQETYLKSWPPALRAWAYKRPIFQALGFDADPRDASRRNRLPDDPRFRYITPLIQWGWNREKCIEVLEADPLLGEIAKRHQMSPVPIKSACFFCPASKPDEVRWLAENHPELAAIALEMERRAARNLISVEGLFRKRTKARAGSWTEFLTGEPLSIGGKRPSPTDLFGDDSPESGDETDPV